MEGIADACKHNGCALIGGETAEMPGFYPDGEYDLAGFIVGVVERERIITGKDVQIGDVILGLPSNGLHTNGYSLARKLLFEVAHYSPENLRQRDQEQSRQRADADAQELLAGAEEAGRRRSAFPRWPTLPAAASPRTCRACCPAARRPLIELGSWPVLPLFEHLQQLGNVPQDEMLRTFNMGLGMLLVVPLARNSRKRRPCWNAWEKKPTPSGRIVKGERKVIYS